VSNTSVTTLRKKVKKKVTPKPAPDALVSIQQTYDATLKQLADAEKLLAKEGALIKMPMFNRSGKKIGTKQVRHPAFLIARTARADLIRLAKLLMLGQPREPEKPASARDQKNALEEIYNRRREIFFRQDELLAERDAERRATGRNPWADGDPAEWTALEAEYVELEAQTAAFRQRQG